MASTTLKQSVAALVNRALARFDIEVVRRSSIDTLKRKFDRFPGHGATAEKADDAQAALAARRPKLDQLRRDYERFAMQHSVWTPNFVEKDALLSNFRDDSAYVWQNRDGNREVNYVVDALYLRARDRKGLLARLSEDSRFGALTVDVGGQLVSRDLLDSVSELLFLDEHVGLDGKALKILDIGAGYGRLAYRAVTAFPTLRYFCTDAIPESTLICEYYLEQRGVADRAKTIPLHEVEKMLSETQIDLALNIQSFSECTLASITFWLDLLAKYKVKYIFIIPGQAGGELLSLESGGARIPYANELEQRGYSLKLRQPKYTDERVRPYGVSPVDYHLYERR